MATRELDLVVHGATSFVGRILCRELVDRQGTDGPLRWAISGRDRDRLEQVAGATGADVEQIVVDSADRAALDALAARTRAVVSTVGPYARYGSPLVAAVVGAGTDYCDLTGETQWMRRMIDEHHVAAQGSGARVVHACGFDSIPSDLGVWFLQQQALARVGEPCERVAMRVHSLRGGASGGTVASMLELVEEAAHDPEVRRVLADPYALAPADMRSGPPQPDLARPAHDPITGRWIAPFVMAAVNTRVVHRTHALLGRPWGPDFRYDEATDTGSGPLGAAAAVGLSAGLAALVGATALGPTRRLVERLAPSPGTGPSERAQEQGSFDLRFHGRTRGGHELQAQVTGDRDPGYGATARMLAEAAVALVELPRDEVPGGFWTPASAFGDRLVERLEAHAGMRFDVLGVGAAAAG